MLSNAKGSMPLYIQIKELFVANLRDGKWAPGELIPSEMQLARDLNVSQGTVRKAITELVENNVLTRKQGRGTFVAYHDSQRALFHFFHIVDNDGNKVMPDSKTLSCRRKRASGLESNKLHLAAGASVVRIKRPRSTSCSPSATRWRPSPCPQNRLPSWVKWGRAIFPTCYTSCMKKDSE